MRFGNSHVDTDPQRTLKIRIAGRTLKLTGVNMFLIAEALENNDEARGFDLRGLEWIAHREAITVEIGDDTYTHDLDNDWGQNSWQRLLVMCKAGMDAPSLAKQDL